MPIYEYACLACGHEFEKMQKISDSPVRKCPSCGRLRARRLISRTSFVLKGNGWYTTDYPSKERKAAMKTESGDGGKTDKSSDGPSKKDKSSDGPSKKKESSKPAAKKTTATVESDP